MALKVEVSGCWVGRLVAGVDQLLIGGQVSREAGKNGEQGLPDKDAYPVVGIDVRSILDYTHQVVRPR